jgi:hypothetical protein
MKRATKQDKKPEPVTFSTVNVNGVPTQIPSTHHVVKNFLYGGEVVEAKDTPWCCSVASETYWSS